MMRPETRRLLLLTYAVGMAAMLGTTAQAQSIPAVETRATPFDTTTPDMRVAARMGGCYDVVVGAWSDPSANGGVMPTPTRIVMDTMRVTQRPRAGFTLASSTPGFSGPGRTLQTSSWSPVGSDSLQLLAWSNGFSSVTFFMRAGADGVLHGTGRYFTDAIVIDPATGRWRWEAYPTAPVRMERTPCGGTPDHTSATVFGRR